MLHAMFCQLSCHVTGTRIWYIGIGRPVNHQDGRVVARDLLDRRELVKPTRFLGSINSTNSLRPAARLSQISIIVATSFGDSGIVGIVNDSFADAGQCLFARDGGS